MKNKFFQVNINKLVITPLLLFVIICLAGCQVVGDEDTSAKLKSGTITITGDGVGKTISLTLDELKAIDSQVVSCAYSSVNNWPISKFIVAKGIPINYLLQKADIKDTAQTIVITGADGYSAFFVREQLEEKRYSYPRLLEGLKDGYVEVPALVAWEHREGTNDITQAISGKLGLFLGQKGLNDVTTAAFVKDVVAIEVLTTPPNQWAEVEAKPASGKVKIGTEVFLNHPEQDYTKIYYTIDGTTPDENSFVYNISTSYYQPQLIKPIIIDKTMTIKAIAIGIGKKDSKVMTFTYEVE